MTTRDRAYLFILIALIAVLIFVMIQRFRQIQEGRILYPDWEGSGGSGGSGSNGSGGSSGSIDCQKQLQRGSRGEEVRILQAWINRSLESGNKIAEDGVFGTITASSLRQAGVESLGIPITSISIQEIPELREYCV